MNIALLLLLSLSAMAAKPKYGAEATLLSQSHDYIKTHPASDYWALSPYYLPQQDDKSCSLASVTMIANAARSGQKLTADDELATQQNVLKKVNDDIWNKGVGPAGHGVSLDDLKTVTVKSLKAFGNGNVTIEVVHMDDLSPKVLAKLHKDLLENEKSAKNFIAANFIQGAFTGDADVGHIAPVAAYDKKNKRVLIMDPDRQWYEPYWVSESTFAKGMATKDKESGKSRGYLFIKVGP
jgi:hypothetical protein